MSNDIIDLILNYLEEINVVRSDVVEEEKVYFITDYFDNLVNKALQDLSIRQAPDPFVSAIILSYLYCAKESSSYQYEIQQVTNIIYEIYKQRGKNETHKD